MLRGTKKNSNREPRSKSRSRLTRRRLRPRPAALHPETAGREPRPIPFGEVSLLMLIALVGELSALNAAKIISLAPSAPLLPAWQTSPPLPDYCPLVHL